MKTPQQKTHDEIVDALHAARDATKRSTGAAMRLAGAVIALNPNTDAATWLAGLRTLKGALLDAIMAERHFANVLEEAATMVEANIPEAN